MKRPVISEGNQYWLDGTNFHRTNGPAIIAKDGTEYFFVNGRRHNMNGPAIYNENGTVAPEWWIDGRKIPAEEHPFNKFLKEHNLPKMFFEDLPEEYRILWIMSL